MILFKTNNRTSIIVEGASSSAIPDNLNTKVINPISNAVDTSYMQKKSQYLYDLKNKLNNLKEQVYTYPLNSIIQLKSIMKKNNSINLQNFSVELSSTHNFNNIYTIEIPAGETGPQGLQGLQGERGEQGNSGDKGSEGNCGLLIK